MAAICATFRVSLCTWYKKSLSNCKSYSLLLNNTRLSALTLLHTRLKSINFVIMPPKRKAAAVKTNAEPVSAEVVPEEKETSSRPKRTRAVKEPPQTVVEKPTTKTRKRKVDNGTEKEASVPKKKEADTEITGKAKKVTNKKPVKQAAAKKETVAEDKPKLQNNTKTDYTNMSFDCNRKNALDQEPNLKISSWNVDGIRACLKKDALSYISKENPDVICLQETKCADGKLPEEIKSVDKYVSFWCSSEKDGYAGVGVLSKVKPLSVEYGIGNDDHDHEGRCITLEFEKFYLVNVYVPNAGRKLVTLPKRLEWNKHFKEYIQNLDAKKPVIITGDMNVAHSEIDLANPKTNTKNAGFTKEEREGMTDFLSSGFTDTFRKLYPDKKDAYTFWSYMSNARAKNTGWRLDYFIVSDRIVDNVCDNVIRNEVFGSDHCPVTLFLNI